MINRLFLIAVLIFGSYAYAQQSDCKVTIADISGSYSGDCKNGLAHGKGVAQGIDRYEGQFNKGMPEGKGTYKWANGNYYEGQFKNGRKEGKGKMVYKDSTVTGFWKEDKYLGEKLIPPYMIVKSMSVSRSSINKSGTVTNGVKIKILMGGSDNTTIEDLSLSHSSGDEYHMGDTYGIQNTFLPLDVKITYRTWNQLHTAQYNVVFEFTINESGTWDVVINN
jgi:hypothetical protein